jgi:hypothetical protein
MTYLAPDVGTEVLEHSLEVNDVVALIEQVTGNRLGAADLAAALAAMGSVQWSDGDAGVVDVRAYARQALAAVM